MKKERDDGIIFKVVLVLNAIAFFLCLIFYPEAAYGPGIFVCGFILLYAYAAYKFDKTKK